MEEISVTTGSRIEMLDITSQIRSAVSKSGTQEGVCTVYCPHTTAAITINENADPDVTADILMKLNKMIPPHKNYRHLEGNSDAHIKSSLIGNSAQIIVSEGCLQLGTWQGIYFCEFDGPRSRHVWVSIK
ncbi:MAG: secondary thiamine-phosphate synthase enzyme YjbQ [Candidatus Marinimicrobia bacterium]|nr:secondary thiamine-phosphate synthase enzyme YjbQ [Candidatus Neomarinimicrobiota bacterium]